VSAVYRFALSSPGMERSMLDADTFLTTLYVVIDDFCKVELRSALHPGPAAALSCSEVLTLAIFGLDYDDLILSLLADRIDMLVNHPLIAVRHLRELAAA
jgi:hypothetical protein